MNTPQDDEAAEPVVLEHDDQETVAQTRPLPEADLSEQERVPPDQLPTIGHVGRYALKYCIGEGGLGTVYAAHDPLLSRLIAIKTMQVNLPEEDREQFNALFLNEAKAAGSLSHPHIVTVYDAGAGSQGTYMAMELLRGKDLRQLLAVGWRPTAAQAALIVRRVADALSYAHHKGVIHRDIKPANIFMVGRTQPRVLDFGIARIRQAESQSSDGLSRFSEVLGGSPYYMAPEQVRREPVDRRVDVYALGVVLYELLTGRRPFSGNDVDEIAEAVLNAAPRPPHEVNPEVPVALSEIVARAMARDLVQRTRSARTLSQELREWLDGLADVGATSGKARGVKAEKPGDKVVKSVQPEKPSRVAKPAGLAASEAKGVMSSNGARPAKGGPRVGVLVGAGVAALALLAGIAWVGWTQSQTPPPPTSTAEVVAKTSPAALMARASAAAPVATDAATGSTRSAAGASAPGSTSPFAVLGQTGGAPAGAQMVASAATVTPVAPTAVTTPVSPAATAATTTTTAAAVSPAVAAPPAKVAPKPVATGTVRLAVSPWGQVFVGKRAMGVTPPMTQFSLPEGRHVITIRNSDAPEHSQTVEVRGGQSVKVSHAF